MNLKEPTKNVFIFPIKSYYHCDHTCVRRPLPCILKKKINGETDPVVTQIGREIDSDRLQTRVASATKKKGRPSFSIAIL